MAGRTIPSGDRRFATWTIEGAIEEYATGLAEVGFQRTGERRFVGSPLPYPGSETHPTIEIVLPAGFPFEQPLVYLEEPNVTARSWHIQIGHDGRGSLCLYSHAGHHGDFPWSDPFELIGRIAQWFESDSCGWPDEPPVLEVNAYLPRSNDNLLVTPWHLSMDRDGIEGGFDQRGDLWVSDPLERPLAIRRRSAEWPEQWETCRDLPRGGQIGNWYDEPVAAVYLDVGEILKPPQSIQALIGVAETTELDKLETTLAARGVGAIIVRYSRGPNTGVIGFIASRVDGRDDYIAFGSTYEMSHDILTLRAGPSAHRVAEKAVAIVGLGAIGSFLADGLVRAGVRRLDLYDGDRLTPGNCVRHLCGLSEVGLTKGRAVRQHLTRAGLANRRDIDVWGHISTLGQAQTLLRSHDLTIDATAADISTGLLIHAAELTGENLLSVCVLGDGEYIRVDRWPIGDNEAHEAAPILSERPTMRLYEAGCGDPVSPTPPYVPQIAGGLAAHMAVEFACKRPTPATRIEKV